MAYGADFTYSQPSLSAEISRGPAWTAGNVHLFNHQTHHRGQLTTLLSQLGIDPGVTDLPMLPDFETRR